MPVQQRDTGAGTAAARAVQTREPEKKAGRQCDVGGGKYASQRHKGRGQCEAGQEDLFLSGVIHSVHIITISQEQGISLECV